MKLSFISDNKTFCTQVKPILSDKTPRHSNILSEGNEIISTLQHLLKFLITSLVMRLKI